MTKLAEYVMQHAECGACLCGRCVDAPLDTQSKQPIGHTADLIFFKVCASDGATPEALLALVKEHKGEYGEVNVLDGKEHNYLELGGWIGDQGLALMLMGLGTVLGVWNLLTPRTLLGKFMTDDLAMQMAGSGMVAVQRSNAELTGRPLADGPGSAPG